MVVELEVSPELSETVDSGSDGSGLVSGSGRVGLGLEIMGGGGGMSMGGFIDSEGGGAAEEGILGGGGPMGVLILPAEIEAERSP